MGFTMLTVITLEELEKFYRDHKLTKSDSFEFLASSTQKFLGEVYEEVNKASMARLIHVHSVGNGEITEVDKEILKDTNNDLLAYLPVLEGDQVLVITNSSKNAMLFSDETLDEIESNPLATKEEKEFYKELLLEEDQSDGSCVYAVSHEIALEDIVVIIYPEGLQEQVLALKESNKERDVLFTKTSLFN